MLRARFKPQRRVGALLRWGLIPFVLVAGFFVYEMYRIIIPFQSQNPFWHEVTINQPVIDGWMYGGLDEEGYLRFYDQTQSVVMPPSSHVFGIDGQFVVIEGYSPTSLTFAEPYDAIPAGWIFTLLAAVGAMGVFAILRFRRKRHLLARVRKMRSSSKDSDLKNIITSKLPRRQPRFRPRKHR